ncbi:hypothetical protein GO009_15455 [Muricauda sp. TY007]|uniref:hypothetical protein n=1 Tax=Allomuricauda sp. TY007 TaxID=2683200 RepID=UPI0013C2447A|nr:hypothetical protein [Muricauda sp. TY007]NDV17420.1 hypothetical protein [Muricauda sp. TY007]
MKNKLRKIKIDGETYLWKREHHHLTEFEYSKCVEKVTVYLEGFKNSPLQLFFREEDNLILKTDIEKEKWCVGYPDGVIWLFKPRADKKPQTDHVDINLNRPAVIAELIKYFNSNGWNPRKASKPFVEENALKFLETIELPRGIN